MWDDMIDYTRRYYLPMLQAIHTQGMLSQPHLSIFAPSCIISTLMRRWSTIRLWRGWCQYGLALVAVPVCIACHLVAQCVPAWPLLPVTHDRSTPPGPSQHPQYLYAHTPCTSACLAASVRPRSNHSLLMCVFYPWPKNKKTRLQCVDAPEPGRLSGFVLLLYLIF